MQPSSGAQAFIVALLILVAQTTLGGDTSPVRPATPPQLTPAVKDAMQSVQTDVLVGNFDRAIGTLEYVRGLPDASDYDRFVIDSDLAQYYTRLGNLAAAVRAEQSGLASSWLTALARTPRDAAASRGYLLLELARNELALQNFSAAADAAAAVLRMLDEGQWDIGFAPEQRAQALQIAALARAKVSVIPEPKPPDTPAPSVAGPDAALSVSLEEQARSCAQVVQQSNAGTLEQLEVNFSAISDQALQTTLSGLSPNETAVAVKVDLFGDAHPVFVVRMAAGGSMGGSDLGIFGSDGAPIHISAEAGTTDIDDGLDPTLIELSGHYFVLARTGNQLLHLSAFTRNRVETTVCGFRWSQTPVQTVRTSVNHPLCKAAMSGTLNYTPFELPNPIDTDAVQASGYEQTFPGDKAALLDINNDGQPRQVITMQFSSGGGRGCENSSLAVLDPTAAKIDKALTDALQLSQDCQGATETPFTFDGKSYVESVSGTDSVDGFRKIVQLNHGKVTTVCDIAVKPQLALLSPVDELIQEARNSQFNYTLNRYIMLKPGVQAAQVVLEASRRPDKPIPLVPEPSYNDSDGESILVSAIRARRYDVLSYLLDNGVDPNLPNHGLQFNPQVHPPTPIMIAVKSGDLTAAQILLDHGATPDAAGEFGWHTVLGDAYAGASVSMFSLLLDHGANPDQVKPDVSEFVQRKPEARLAPEKIDLLLHHGADADHWVNTLFNAIALRSGLAVAQHLAEREGVQMPESAQFVPVRTIWVENLLSNPTRAPDNGLEPLLREALDMRDSNPRQLPPAASPTGLPVAPVVQAQDAASIPLGSRDAFLTYLAPLLQQRVPGSVVSPDLGMASVLITDPDGVKIGHLTAQQQYQWCRASPQECSQFVATWLNTATGSIQDQMRAPDPDAIRVMVGPREMFEREAGPRPAGTPQILVRKCAGDLISVLYADRPGSPRYLDGRHLAQLHMTEDQVFALGDTHVRVALRPVSALVVPTHDHPIQFIDNSPFESSRILWTAEWAPLAQRLGGELIAAIPAANLFVYARGGSTETINALRQFAAAAYPSADRPLSTAVFRWTPRGWQTLP